MQELEESILIAMISTSAALMFGAMYLNSYQLSHVRWSETRLYMTFLMASVMAVVMLMFMRKMYSNKKRLLMMYPT